MATELSLDHIRVSFPEGMNQEVADQVLKVSETTCGHYGEAWSLTEPVQISLEMEDMLEHLDRITSITPSLEIDPDRRLVTIQSQYFLREDLKGSLVHLDTLLRAAIGTSFIQEATVDPIDREDCDPLKAALGLSQSLRQMRKAMKVGETLVGEVIGESLEIKRLDYRLVPPQDQSNISL